MMHLTALRVRTGLVGALALIGTGLACTSSVTGPTGPAGSPGLHAASQRITDEAIGEDLAVLRSWQARLDGLSAMGSNDPARRYLVAKAGAWIKFSRDEYWANDRGAVTDESLAEAIRLMAVLVDRDVHEVEQNTKLVADTRRVRPELWTEVERFKAHPRFELVAEQVAQLEVELVRAGHDQAAGAACSAEPHEQRAGELSAYVDSVLKSAPPPVVPMPEPVLVPDRDGDGVPDVLDCCPNTPRGMAVDARGCPPPTPQTVTVLEGVEFDTDKFVLRTTSRMILDSVVTELLRRPTIPVEVSGHTDWIAPERYNLTLSTNRARAVRQYLVNKGVSGDRITAAGYGESRPRATNTTREGRQRNRRVELTWQLPVQLDLLPSCAEVTPPPTPTEPDATAVTLPATGEIKAMLLDYVLFPSASIALRPAARARLARIARQLQSREAFVLEISGHADEVGDPDSNLALSLARAYKVRAYLIELGAPLSRVVVRGYGADQPLVAARTESARARNRRVEISIRPAGQ